MKNRLKIELIPGNCAGKNLRTLFPKEWPEMSRYVRTKAELTCACCGKHCQNLGDMDAHEVWKYKTITDENGKKQHRMILKRVEALCKDCHRVKHICFSYSNGYYEDAVDHFMKVNECSFKEFKEAERKANEKCQKRSEHKWKLKISKKEAWQIIKGEK